MKQLFILHAFMLILALFLPTFSDDIPEITPKEVAIPETAFDSTAMHILADTVHDNIKFQVINILDSAVNESNPIQTIYLAVVKLGKQVEKRMYRVQDMAFPKVENIEIGPLTFNMTLSYGLDVPRRQVDARLTFNRVANR